MKNNILTPVLLFVSFICSIVLFLSSCSRNVAYNRLETERLFMQTTKPEIGFINQGGLKGQDGFRTVSEEVSFRGSSGQADSESYLNSKLDTSKVYELNEVVVSVKSNFTSERNGKANIDFQIMLSEDIMDPNWRMTLTPRLIDGDSIHQLDTLILTGEGFREKQKGDYEAYDEFLGAIVDPSAYDSLYIDWKALYKEIQRVQRRNYNDYRSAYNKVVGYENWRKMNEMEFLDMEALAMRHKRHLEERYWRKGEKEVLKNLTLGKDTLGIHAKYREKSKKDYINYLKTRFSLKWLGEFDENVNLHKEKDVILERSHIPRRYKDIHESKIRLADLKAKPFTKEDSVRLAKHHYLIDEIVLNEMNMNRKEDVFKETVQFPYRNDFSRVRLDSVLSGETGFVYNYRQVWPVRAGMKNIRVVLNGMVEGIDRSVFRFPDSDTLTYYIASLHQLMDESLVTERKQLYKNMFDKITINPKFANGKTHKFDSKLNANTLDQFLEAYNIYTSKPEYRIDTISVYSYTDLRGEWGDNYDLSYHRGNSVVDYLKSKTNVYFDVKPKGEDWSLLVKEIKSRSDMPNASAIIDMLTSATFPDKTEEDIKKTYPADYKVMVDHIYPRLQRIEFMINISRTDIEENTMKETYREDYAEALRLLKNREYMPALEILANYPDFNTALCLVCLGYIEKAEDLLLKLPKSAKNEYLLSIINVRKDNMKKASEYLISACKLDGSLYDRVALDSEVCNLADKYNLWPKLNQQ